MKLDKASKDLSYCIELNLKKNPHRVFVYSDQEKITFYEVHKKILSIHLFLKKRGIKKNQKIIGYFNNSIEQIILMLAVVTYGAIWIPLSTDREQSYLNFVFNTTNPKLVFTKEEFVKLFKKINLKKIISVEKNLTNFDRFSTSVVKLAKQSLHSTCAIVFTSGTSGPPKGVMITQKMLLLSAIGNHIASKQTKQDGYLLWEALHHIAGIQLVVMALLFPTRVYLIKKFSKKIFWKLIRNYKITILHYLGGILEILLKNNSSKFEKNNFIKIAYGAGCRPSVYRSFVKRFKIPIREVYGMTESSSFTTINYNNTQGVIGIPVPWLNVKLIDQNKKVIKKINCIGEIAIKEKIKGSITPGYFGQRKINKKNFFQTGDLAKYNSQYELIYMGRSRDSIRVRGINISAWDLENITNAHKKISESAALPVSASVGENEILIIILKKNNSSTSLCSYANSLKNKFSKISFPRYWSFIDKFPRTPTQRIDKKSIEINQLSIFDFKKKKIIRLKNY